MYVIHNANIMYNVYSFEQQVMNVWKLAVFSILKFIYYLCLASETSSKRWVPTFRETESLQIKKNSNKLTVWTSPIVKVKESVFQPNLACGNTQSEWSCVGGITSSSIDLFMSKTFTKTTPS
jgi:hypothetical protein